MSSMKTESEVAGSDAGGAAVVADGATPHAIARELQRQRLRMRGWQTVDMMESGQKPEAIDTFGVIATDPSAFSWIVAVIAGIFLGIVAIMVEACTRFVISFRIGVCEGYFWLGPEICCAYASEEESCKGFKPWGVFFGGEDGRHVALLNFFFYVFWASVFACAAAFFCKTYSPFAAGGGIIEVKTIVSGELLERYLGFWTLMTKAVGVCMSTGSSLVVGKEGPFVHIGSCICDLVATRFGIRSDNQRRELIAAGAAGGVAVAFGAPIGGVIFAIEEISGAFRYRSMMQSLIVGTVAVVMVKAVDMFHTGRIVQFSINYKHQWHWFEIPLFMLIGSLGGGIGALFNVCNRYWCGKRRTKWARWKVTEVLALVLISAVLHYIIPFCKGGMLELLADLYQDCAGSSVEVCEKPDYDVMIWTLIAGTVKLALAIVSVGCCVPAGLLVPSLCIGALYGRAFGIFVSALTQSSTNIFFSECAGHSTCVIPGVYAIVGSAAVLCGVTRMTICLAVIMFELTGGLEYLVPVVFGLLASKATAANLFHVESIYDIGIEDNKLPILEGHITFDGPELLSDIYQDKPMIKILETETVNSLAQKLRISERRVAPTGYPVVRSYDNPYFIGYVERRDIENVMGAQPDGEPGVGQQKVWFGRRKYQSTLESADEMEPIDMGSMVVRPPMTLDPSESVHRVLALFHSLHSARVIVAEDGLFRGIVTRTDLLNFVRERSEHHH